MRHFKRSCQDLCNCPNLNKVEFIQAAFLFVSFLKILSASASKEIFIIRSSEMNIAPENNNHLDLGL